MLHIAQKAFAPGKLPFPLLHVDTTWKFREMIAFRDETAARLGLDLLVHINEAGRARGVSPVASGSAVHTQVMKTEGLRQALDKWTLRCRLRRRAPRRGKEPRQGAHLLAPLGQPWLGPAQPAARSCGACSTPASSRANRCACFRCPTGPSSTSGTTSAPRDIPVVPLYFAKERPVVERDGALIMVDDERLPLLPGETPAHAMRCVSARSAAIR